MSPTPPHPLTAEVPPPTPVVLQTMLPHISSEEEQYIPGTSSPGAGGGRCCRCSGGRRLWARRCQQRRGGELEGELEGGDDEILGRGVRKCGREIGRTLEGHGRGWEEEDMEGQEEVGIKGVPREDISRNSTPSRLGAHVLCKHSPGPPHLPRCEAGVPLDQPQPATRLLGMEKLLRMTAVAQLSSVIISYYWLCLVIQFTPP